MKSRNYTIVLYPEDPTHADILLKIINMFDYAYILHDKDTWEKDNIDKETKEIINKKGEKKKPHYHILISLKNPRSEKRIKEQIGGEKIHIEPSSFYEMTRYLIHLDDPEKYQYKSQEIHTNMRERIERALQREFDKNEEKARILLEFIFDKSNQSILTFKELTKFAMENDCLIELQKKSYFYNQFCDKTGFGRI